MLAIINSILLNGLEGNLVQVQVDISNGLPYWEIVGLPDLMVKESKERVKVAVRNSGYQILSKRITINLAPANTKKVGVQFDLPIAIGILVAMGIIKCKTLEKYVFLGELSLDGTIKRTSGVLPICIEAKKMGMENIILSYQNIQEASLVKGINVIPANNLNQIINHLNQKETIKYKIPRKVELKQNIKEMDFAEVKGQENAKRALEISAAGGHNCILIGHPGVGKTMLAKRFSTILPDLTVEEALEITKIYSISEEIKDVNELMQKRPFRIIHHTISETSLIGGGRIPKPGEVSLAHNGVLFLDELSEFNRKVLESLRGPMEEKSIVISRLNSVVKYPCNFMFIASVNPCPCGYYGSDEKTCICSEQTIQKHFAKFGGPLLDRVDINVYVNSVKHKKILANENTLETSENIKARVDKARKIQLKRYKEENIYSNSELSTKLIEKYCKLNKESEKLLKNVFEKFKLSVRAYTRILKVARTIADLDGKENIETLHIAEAIQYRLFDKENMKGV